MASCRLYVVCDSQNISIVFWCFMSVCLFCSYWYFRAFCGFDTQIGLSWLTGIMLLRDLSVSLIYPNWTTTNARKCEQSYDATCYIKHPTTWWRHQMETFSPLLARSAGNPPVIGEFPSQMPVKRSFYIFFDLRLNKRLSKLSRGWWFETPWRPLWRHCNEICARLVIFVVVVVVVTWYSAIWPISFGATSQALGQ